MDDMNQDIMDKMTKVCICKAINRATIKNAIQDGANSIEMIQKATGAGLGCCKGKRCLSKILEILDEHNGEENKLE